MITAVLIIFLVAALTVGLAAAYLDRLRLTRPPIGVFNRSDVVVLTGGIVLAPMIYLLLPPTLAGVLFGLTMFSVLLFALQPMTISRPLRWLLALAAIVSTGWIGLAVGTQNPVFATLNGIVIVVGIIGISNLWVQTGMRTSQVIGLAIVITLYDVVATGILPVTATLLDRLGSTPYMPVIFWPVGDHALGLGLGDLLMITTIALVAYKGFGRRAALLTGTALLVALAAVLAAVAGGFFPSLVPTMAVLGPVVIATGFVLRRLPHERSAGEFFQDTIAKRGESADRDAVSSSRLDGVPSTPLSTGGGETR